MLPTSLFDLQCMPLANVDFGFSLELGELDLIKFLENLESKPEQLLEEFYAHHGLMVLRGFGSIGDQPEILVRISKLFGPEVENYRSTITTNQFFHDSVDHILVLSNRPPCNFEPPKKPIPAVTADGGLPISHPHRTGWHTDQSYRRPPPDISLLLGLVCPPPNQAQTLYADGISAYRALPDKLKQKIENLEGIHALRWTGRTESEVRAGDPVKTLLQHQKPQRHPVVRKHPNTGQSTLYLCDQGQMDFLDGPFADMEPGVDGEGAALLYDLMKYLTAPMHVYTHNWCAGDLAIHDNRNMIHTGTWYDSPRYSRLMWRTTVMGNPGKHYANEPCSWIPVKGVKTMQGLEDLEF